MRIMEGAFQSATIVATWCYRKHGWPKSKICRIYLLRRAAHIWSLVRYFMQWILSTWPFFINIIVYRDINHVGLILWHPLASKYELWVTWRSLSHRLANGSSRKSELLSTGWQLDSNMSAFVGNHQFKCSECIFVSFCFVVPVYLQRVPV